MSAITIWDKPELPIPSNREVLLWSSKCESERSELKSILEIIEKNGDSVRKSYFDWVEALGIRLEANHLLFESFNLINGMNYWFLTALYEKNNYSASFMVNEVLKLIALEKFVVNNKTDLIEYIGNDSCLRDILSDFSSDRGIKFASLYDENKKLRNRVFGANSLDFFLAVKSTAWLMIRVINRFPLAKVGALKLEKNTGASIFFSYFSEPMSGPHIPGSFRSKYWGELPNHLNKKGEASTWVHIFPDELNVWKSLRYSRQLRALNSINLNQVHVSLESFITPRVIISVFRGWLKIRRSSNPIEKLLSQSKIREFQVWDLYAREWKADTRGIRLMEKLINLYLIQAAVSKARTPARLFYLFEGQSWEAGLNFVWRKVSGAKIYAVQHATIRYWDLRSFSNHQNTAFAQKNCIYTPDVILLNGSLAELQLRRAKFDRQRFLKVEALRYSSLHHFRSRRKRLDYSAGVRVLILGSSLSSENIRFASIVTTALTELSGHYKIILKPHPATSFDSALLKDLRVEVDNNSIEALSERIDIVLIPSSSSACIDVSVIQLPFLIINVNSTLDFSPLLGLEGYKSISTPGELAASLKVFQSNGTHVSPVENLVEVDDTYTTWLGLF